MFIDVDMKIPFIGPDVLNPTGVKWPITNTMWTHIQYGSLEDYMNHISDCAVNAGFHDYKDVTEYYYRFEYNCNIIGGYILNNNRYFTEETMSCMLRKDPWNRNFICFPYKTDSRYSVNGLTYMFEPIYKHNRTAIVGYLISTSIDGKIIWCVDMFKNDYEA